MSRRAEAVGCAVVQVRAAGDDPHRPSRWETAWAVASDPTRSYARLSALAGIIATMTQRPTNGSRQSPDEAENEGSRLLAVELAPRIDALQARVETAAAATVADRSPLAGDDRASRPFQLSHAAWYSIVHAADNLQALRALTVRGEAPRVQVLTYPYAAYPLLRAAIENASAALWLLAPMSRDVRLTRRFQHLLQDSRMGDEAAALLGHESTTHKKRLARLEEVIANRPDVHLSACKRGVGYRSIVRAAAEGNGTDPDIAEVIWRLLSGLTHGDTWAGLTATDRNEVAVSEDGTVVTFQTTSSLANVANMTGYAVALTEAAMCAYDRRRTPPYSALLSALIVRASEPVPQSPRSLRG